MKIKFLNNSNPFKKSHFDNFDNFIIVIYFHVYIYYFFLISLCLFEI